MEGISSVEPLKPASVEELSKILISAEVDTSEWGIGLHKSPRQLLDEIHEGETLLWHDRDGTLRRTIRVVWGNIWCQVSRGEVYRLEETMQVKQHDGSQPDFQTRILPASMAEKMKGDELPLEAISRGLKEELGLRRVRYIHESHRQARSFMPRAYPGLSSECKEIYYDIWLYHEDFRPDGYREIQPEKISYFEWFDISASQAWRRRTETR